MGQNAELINKAFSRIINDNSKKQDKKEIKNKMNIDDNELETDLNKIKENNIDEGTLNDNNDEIKNKLKPNDFLKMTMNLLND